MPMECLLCGSKRMKLFLKTSDRLSTAKDGHLMICADCKLVYTENNDYSLKGCYPDEYYWHLDREQRRADGGLKGVGAAQADFRSETDDTSLCQEGVQGYFGVEVSAHHNVEKNNYSLISKKIKDVEEWFIKLFLYPEIKAFCSRVNKRDARILDVGCGNGLFLKMLKDCGFSDLAGLEMDVRSVQYGRQRYGLNIINRRFEPAIFEENRFDVVILNHVLEHFEDPEQFLYDIRRIIRDNGVVMVSVPNIESWQARALKGRWFGIEYPRHRYHFSKKTLMAILEDAGFQADKVFFVSMRTNAVCLILSLFPSFDPSRIENYCSAHGGACVAFLLKGVYLLLLFLTIPIGFLENRMRRGTTLTVFAEVLK